MSDTTEHTSGFPGDDRGLRFNAGKLRYDLMPPEALEEIVRVLTYGAKKYGAGNWQKGMPWSECRASLLRHAEAWAKGQDTDPETGIHHMAHVATNAVFLLWYSMHGKGKDDRGPFPFDFIPFPSVAPVGDEQSELDV